MPGRNVTEGDKKGDKLSPQVTERANPPQTANACFDIRVDQTERLLAGLKAGLYDMVFCSY